MLTLALTAIALLAGIAIGVAAVLIALNRTEHWPY